jgi:hypothetical protein
MSSSSTAASYPIDDASVDANNNSSVEGAGAVPTEKNHAASRDHSIHSYNTPSLGNVMVLSWITPTNNSGRFIFSINKARYTASSLAPTMTESTTASGSRSSTIDNTNDYYQTGIEFILSVPTRDMEQVILDTGSISGRCGSKFSSERVDNRKNCSKKEITNDDATTSNRKRKKLKKQQLSAQGVVGLTPIPYCDFLDTSSRQTSLFAITGTVAHLKCRTYGVIGSQILSDERLYNTDDDKTSPPIIDHNHLLVMAEVLDAHVHPLYWDEKKLIFCPISVEVPPYLTFLGSQTFGYVTTSS